MMDLHLTEEHQAFRASLQDFIQKHGLPPSDEWEERRQEDRELLSLMGDMGYLGLIFPEQYGGMDLEFFDAFIFCDDLSKCFSGGFARSVLVAQFMSAPCL